MVVDRDGQALTARTDPALAGIDVTVDTADGEAEPRLTLVASDGVLCVLAGRSGTARAVTVWGDRVAAVDAGDGAARWLSEHLGRPCRLVFMPNDTRRAVDEAYGRAEDIVSFADGYPLLLTLTASLDDLNRRLDEPVAWDRFRPNVVVDGFTAFAEDGWRQVDVGTVRFRVAKPCARCVMVTLDPDTGRFGKEPMRTLAGYRRQEGNVFFGQNIIPEHEGVIRVGDRVRVVD